MPRLKSTISDEADKFIRRQAQKQNVSISFVVSELIEAGAEALYGIKLEKPAPHGDISRIYRMAEYKQCPQCGQWNVGIHEGVRICADCGWKEGDE